MKCPIMLKIALSWKENVEIEKYYKKNKPAEYKKYKMKYHGDSLIGGLGGGALGVAAGALTKMPGNVTGLIGGLGGAAGAYIGGRNRIKKMYNRDTLNKVRVDSTMKAAASTLGGGIYGHSRGKQVALKKINDENIGK